MPETSDGERLDAFLRRVLPELGRQAVRDAIARGEVRIEGAAGRASTRLKSGQRITLALSHASDAAIADASLPLSIVYEDESLVIANKPAGMPCHPLRAGERGTLVSALLARYPEIANFGYSRREPGIVHRLDTLSSGLVLCARSEAVFAALRAQLERGEIDKRYFVLCAGGAPEVGEHRGHLLARGPRVRVALDGRDKLASGYGRDKLAAFDGRDKLASGYGRDKLAPGYGRDELAAMPGARAIVTEVLRVGAAGPFAQVELRVHRAARHQVRAHLAALGHPLVGDLPYGGPSVPGLDRHCLHASAIELRHPVTGRSIAARAELPSELAALLPQGCVAIVS